MRGEKDCIPGAAGKGIDGVLSDTTGHTRTEREKFLDGWQEEDARSK